jgi:hypothetical protein
VELALV